MSNDKSDPENVALACLEKVSNMDLEASKAKLDSSKKTQDVSNHQPIQAWSS